jgi:hypothetical protein
MVKFYARLVGALLFIIGLWGFLGHPIPNIVQLDLFQSLIYVVLGAVGLKLGFSASTPKTLARYATATGITGLVFVLFGLTLPNFFDLFHLEVAEHVFHVVLGVAGSLVGGKHRPTT